MIYIISMVIILAVDQISKLLVSVNFALGESVRVFPYFHLTYVHNLGAAFGMFANYQWLFIILGIAAVFFALYNRKLIMRQNALIKWGIALAIAGAIGNLIDRIRIGAVIDFIDLSFFPMIFNVADMSIVFGVALLIWEVMVNERKQAQE